MSKPVKHGNNWRVRWIDHDGVRRSAVYESFKEAQSEVRKRQAETAEIIEGLRAKPPADRTFAEMCDYWMANRAIHKRNIRDDKSIIDRHLRPAFGTLKLKDLGIEQVDAFRVKLPELSKKTVANILTLLISLLNAAVELGWLLKAPRIKKPKIRLISADFRYLRTDSEVVALLTAAKENGEDAYVLYATAIYTGMREGELAALRWSDVNFPRRLITVQRSYDGPTKAEDVRYVPILDVLLPILREWKLKTPGTLVFSNRDGNMLQPCGRIFTERLHRILDAAGFEKSEVKRQRHCINFHCLRHTFASHWVMKGGDLFKLQKVLGHKTVQMTMRYAHLTPSAFAEDHGRFSTMAVAATETPVVELTGRKTA